MGKYIEHCFVARPEPDGTFWTDRIWVEQNKEENATFKIDSVTSRRYFSSNLLNL